MNRDEILQKLDQRSGQVIEEKPDFVKKGESMIAKLVPLKQMVIESYKDFPQLGNRFRLHITIRAQSTHPGFL